MDVILKQDVVIADWVANRIPEMRTFRDFGIDSSGKPLFVACGFALHDKLRAGAVFTNYTGFDVTLSLAKDGKWFGRSVLNYLANVIFNQWHCVRASAIVAAHNKEGQTFCEKIGFIKEGVTRLGYNGKEDAVRYGLLKHQCKWLEH